MKSESNTGQCDHIIGLLELSGYSALVTLGALIDHIKHRNEINEMLRATPCFNEVKHLMYKPHTLQHYADLRRSTNLNRFKNCPYCGIKIDWKAIGKIEM